LKARKPPTGLGGHLIWGPAQRSSPDDAGRLPRGGRRFCGAHIYVISPDGAVAKVIPHVKRDTLADEVLGALAAA